MNFVKFLDLILNLTANLICILSSIKKFNKTDKK